MKSNIPHKKLFVPDRAWKLSEYKYAQKINGRYNHKNNKRFYVNLFNRKIRYFFRELIRRG